jgi:ubiquinone/menaquinone biosynthesis C-methylase UbiE
VWLCSSANRVTAAAREDARARSSGAARESSASAESVVDRLFERPAQLSAVPTFDEEVRVFYERYAEAERLETDFRLEAARTRELIERFLPPAPATVLDVGGGPGSYALWLAERGYEVHLRDPVPLHVEQANAASQDASRPRASAIVGDARELDHPDDGVDALLMLGPLYHLTEADERARALTEAGRVLRPGGRMLAAAISRFAPALDGLGKGFLLDPEFEPIVERDLQDGQHRNPTRHERWFTTAYLHLPDELGSEVAAAGFHEVEVLAIEGVGDWLPDLDDWLDDTHRRGVLMRTLHRLEREPSLLGVSPHLMAVGRA